MINQFYVFFIGLEKEIPKVTVYPFDSNTCKTFKWYSKVFLLLCVLDRSNWLYGSKQLLDHQSHFNEMSMLNPEKDHNFSEILTLDLWTSSRC
jgi:hypothetical protein